MPSSRCTRTTVRGQPGARGQGHARVVAPRRGVQLSGDGLASRLLYAAAGRADVRAGAPTTRPWWPRCGSAARRGARPRRCARSPRGLGREHGRARDGHAAPLDHEAARRDARRELVDDIAAARGRRPAFEGGQAAPPRAARRRRRRLPRSRPRRARPATRSNPTLDAGLPTPTPAARPEPNALEHDEAEPTDSGGSAPRDADGATRPGFQYDVSQTQDDSISPLTSPSAEEARRASQARWYAARRLPRTTRTPAERRVRRAGRRRAPPRPGHAPTRKRAGAVPPPWREARRGGRGRGACRGGGGCAVCRRARDRRRCKLGAAGTRLGGSEAGVAGRAHRVCAEAEPRRRRAWAPPRQ